MTEWTPRQIDDLRKFCNEGLSFSEIGDRLGTTRDKIAGKVRRLKLEDAHARAEEERRKAQERRDAGEVFHGCRWLEGPAKNLNYCCKDTIPGSSWCPDHRARVYLPRSKHNSHIHVNGE